MKLVHTPHRFYVFDNPTHAPFNQLNTRWPTIVGKFFAPICRSRGVKAFVFIDHGAADIELRLACRNYKVVEAKMDRLAKTLGIIRRPNTTTTGQTVGNGAYHGPDWIEANRGKQWMLARRRSELLFKFLHAGCELYLDTLVSAAPYYQHEPIASLPLKNLFERCQHLIANFSEAEFQTLITLKNGNREAKTGGMTQPVQAIVVPNVGEVYQLHL